jgi:hypothetical protein
MGANGPGGGLRLIISRAVPKLQAGGRREGAKVRRTGQGRVGKHRDWRPVTPPRFHVVMRRGLLDVVKRGNAE